jgi:hypothetical protein
VEELLVWQLVAFIGLLQAKRHADVHTSSTNGLTEAERTLYLTRTVGLNKQKGPADPSMELVLSFAIAARLATPIFRSQPRPA